jgi:hypothetical protein
MDPLFWSRLATIFWLSLALFAFAVAAGYVVYILKEKRKGRTGFQVEHDTPAEPPVEDQRRTAV